MKNKIFTLLSILFGLITIAANTDNNSAKNKSALNPETINVNDTVVFDISNSIITGNYIDIPVLILSDDSITSLDFSFVFDTSNLTYVSFTDLTTYMTPTANYYAPDQTLNFSSYSLSNYKLKKQLVLLRFSFIDACKINKNEFSSFFTYLNGKKCSYKVTGNFLTANFSNNKICSGLNVSFNDASVLAGGGSISSWAWDFGNTTTSTSQNPVTSYTNPGNYTVKLIVTSNTGCKDTASKLVRVDSSPVANFTSVSDCKTGSVAFTDKSTIASGAVKTWKWTFGDTDSSSLQNPSHTYLSAGTYTVALTIKSDSGCTSIFTNTVSVNIPTAKFVAANGCAGSTVNFTDSSKTSSGTIAAWKWYFGDGNTSIQQNASHSYATAGTYTVSLKITTSQNCSDSIAKTIIIENKPIVKFGGDILSGCSIPLTVNFSDSSTASPGSKYLWNFGDTDTSSSKNISHLYINSGIYTVRHYVTTSIGCSDSLVKTAYVKVSGSPTAKFITANGCTGSAINFTDSSKISSGTITGWKWYFGDGTTDTLQNTSHIYSSAGTYTVSLKVATGQGCSDSIPKTIIVGSKPVVKFGANNVTGCVPLTVNFSDSSSVVAGSTYYWDFGDGTSSVLKNNSHIYTVAGTYTIKHYVANPGGCTDSLVKVAYIKVGNGVTAKFTAVNGCSGSSINFTDSSKISSGPITGWNWYFGDGNTSPQQDPSYIYGSAGTYTVSLKVTTGQGCSDSTTRKIIIENKPVVNFFANILSGCNPLPVSFYDSSNTASGSKYFWSFGDTTISTLNNITHTYIAAGVYTVKHIVTTSAGCVDSIIKTAYIKVYSGPTASFVASPDTVRLPEASVSFTNTSLGYTSWMWNFGDSTLSSLKDPVHKYTNTGNYKVCLTVKNSNSCPATYCDTVTVLPPDPIAIPEAFTPNGDNLNDVFRVRGGTIAEMELRIFNEWGNQLFISEKQNEGWDGSFKGLPQPEGAYEYTLKGKTKDNKIINMLGVVNLVR